MDAIQHDNFKFYKKVSEDEEVSKEFFSRLFDWYVERLRKEPSKNEQRSGAEDRPLYQE
jgi:hypothetical protein